MKRSSFSPTTATQNRGLGLFATSPSNAMNGRGYGLFATSPSSINFGAPQHENKGFATN